MYEKKLAGKNALTIDSSVYFFVVYCIHESVGSSTAIVEVKLGF